jgi:phenylalanyl-tRNA synthetase alpha chain
VSHPVLTEAALARALALRDLTDPAQGRHAMQELLRAVTAALTGRWRCPVLVERRSPVVPVADNYDRLHYPPGGAARDARHTRYVTQDTLLRTQTSALVPPLLRRLAAATPRDLLLVCPGLVYRRDVIDRLHTGEPHQVDLWRIRLGPPLGPADLDGMIAEVAAAAAPGRAVRTGPAAHPYTLGGREIEVADGERWVEIGECGLALPALLAEAGLPPDASGLAMGLGLDRLLMLRKGMDDIRLLRATDPRIAGQLRDLTPYRPVSRQPSIRRDLSVAVPAAITPEELGDRVREALGPRATEVESVEVSGEASAESLGEAARARLGLCPGQKNVLLRVVLRSPERTLTAGEANSLRDAVYAAVHQGAAHQWASGRPPEGWQPPPA